jgi:regulatory protein
MKTEKPLDKLSLQNSGQYYLARYASSSANLRRILQQKIGRSGTNAEAHAHALVEELIEQWIENGTLSDTAYASACAQSLRSKGKSKQHIVSYLQQKGIDPSIIASVFSDETDEEGVDPEIEAAHRWLKRKRRGSYRPEGSTAIEQQKDREALHRQGFSSAVVRTVLKEEIS